MSNEFDSQKELIDHLRNDFKFIKKSLGNEPSGFWSRTFIKTTVSLIEAEIFILKQETLRHCRENQFQLSPELLLFLNNKKYEINRNGKINERLLQIRLKDDIKFVFDQVTSIKGHKLHTGFEDSGWSKVISIISVRNRLTHPKSVDDMNVSSNEENDCKLAFNWFINNLAHFLDQEKDDIEKRAKEEIKDFQNMRDQFIKESTKGT